MTMVTDPTLDDDRWGLFVMYKRKFWFEENDYDVPESYFYQNGEEIKPNTIELVKKFLKQVRESRGYDVDCYPPPMFESPFSPLPLEEMRNSDKRGYARVVGAAKLAIQNICQETMVALCKLFKPRSATPLMTIQSFKSGGSNHSLLKMPLTKVLGNIKARGQLRIKCKEGISKGTKESKPTIVRKLLLDASEIGGVYPATEIA
ncbi:ATP-dependent dethiobiotin synthetase BioD 2 [Striga asiatica]|uniref:ATP-dependent dethiobiotin synthetase BioD 2 n=1 Tax=Striga asiatica TaxID=4170 RepID=A0A5A7R120_STRAF|nr:ATP-dependent dethiobiotin synthetase BioD 2 [Striga asiatica]